MKKPFITAMLAGLVVAASAAIVIADCGGCGASAGDEAKAHDHDHDHSVTAEVGCAGCIFGKEDAKGCEAAVKIDDQVYMLKGTDINAHEEGLCKASKQAKLTGEVDGDDFVASDIELQ